MAEESRFVRAETYFDRTLKQASSEWYQPNHRLLIVGNLQSGAKVWHSLARGSTKCIPGGQIIRIYVDLALVINRWKCLSFEMFV